MKKDIYIILFVFLIGLVVLWMFICNFGIIIFDVLIKPDFVII